MSLDSPQSADLLRRLVQLEKTHNRLFKQAGLAVFVSMGLLLVPEIASYFQVQNTPSIPLSWREVNAEVNRGELSLALRSADQLLAKAPRSFEGHYRKGAILWMLGDKEAAHASFTTAYQIFPTAAYREAWEAARP